MNKHQIELFRSAKSDDWATPDWLYKDLNDEFHFDLDPCPLNSKIDGLQIDWKGNIFCNPPYSKVKEFLIKAHEELTNGNAQTIVFLVFANTDTNWFHEYVYGKSELRFLKGRIKFVGMGGGNSAMRPSMICIFRHKP